MNDNIKQSHVIIGPICTVGEDFSLDYDEIENKHPHTSRLHTKKIKINITKVSKYKPDYAFEEEYKEL